MNSMGGTGGMIQSNRTPSFRGDIIPKGYRKKAAQLQQYTPEQLALFKQTFSHLGPQSYLSRLAGGDESLYEEMEAPALRQFNELQGNIANRFSAGGGQGSLSARRSSGFQQATSSAASDFASQLQAQRQSLQQNAIKDLLGMSSELLNKRPYERSLVQKPQKESSGWGGIIGSGLGAAGGFFAGGPAGALQGAKLGYDVGSMF